MSTQLLNALGLSNHPRILSDPCRAIGGVSGSPTVVSENPSTGRPIACVRLDDADSCEREIAASVEAFRTWREVPAPHRGLVVRAIGEELRRFKQPLGELVSLEMGKILAEGLGEVQESIDIADFAVGLSRQLPGQVFPSERPGHRMFEQWLPLGPVGVITAFNFPNAVWAWNAMLAAVCGDTVLWKPSLLTPLTAIATNDIADRVATSMGHPGIFRLVIGADDVVGEKLIADRRVPLISATGSCRMGRHVGKVVAGRLGRCLLELGGNNAVIVNRDADLELAVRSVVFGAVGTAGQRCTTTRRLILHETIAEAFVSKLTNAYRQVIGRIGDPQSEGTLVGPLINERAVEGYLYAIACAKEQGGTVLIGGQAAKLEDGHFSGGHFVEPTIVLAPNAALKAAQRTPGGDQRLPIALEETFAPILYVFTFKELHEAIAMNNGVDQGLSSAIFSDSVAATERFLSVTGSGSDCGIANVNIGTSGAEIGGAFGGEKDTGGGRESGSDSWRAYMRRQTCTINYGGGFALAQGIRFE